MVNPILNVLDGLKQETIRLPLWIVCSRKVGNFDELHDRGEGRLVKVRVDVLSSFFDIDLW